VTRTESLVLRAAAAWTVFIWGFRMLNLLGDETRSLGFKAVHLALAMVSVVFAVAIWRIATRNRRGAPQRAGTSS